MIEINLLPKEFQKKGFSISFDKTFMYVLGGVAALIIFMVAVSLYQNYRIGEMKDNLKEAQGKIDNYREEVNQIDELNKLKAEVLSRISAIQTIDKNRTYWVDLLSDLTKRVPAYIWLTDFEQGVAKTKRQPPKTKGKAPQKAKPINVKSTLKGYAFSLNSLAAFIIQLNKSAYFDNLSISSIELEEIEKKPMYSFSIQCDLKKETKKSPQMKEG